MRPASNDSPLKGLKVASPCHVEWSAMTGDERTRHCQACRMSVFNISDMTRGEAEAFLADRVSAERTCIRFYQRSDGTVITDDCPVGLRHARALARAARTRIVAAVSLVVSLFGAMPGCAFAKSKLAPIKNQSGTAANEPAVLLGEICLPEPKMGKPAAPADVRGRMLAVPTTIGGPATQDAPVANPTHDASVPDLQTLGPGHFASDRPSIPGAVPGGDSGRQFSVSGKILAPEGSWLEQHRTVTKSAIWALRSASLNWQINAGMLESSRSQFHDAAEQALSDQKYFETVLSLANEGNCLYYQGKGRDAAEKYEQALRLLEQPEFKNKPALQKCIATNLVFATRMHREKVSESELAKKRELLPYLGNDQGSTISWLLDDKGNAETTIALKD